MQTKVLQIYYKKNKNNLVKDIPNIYDLRYLSTTLCSMNVQIRS